MPPVEHEHRDEVACRRVVIAEGYGRAGGALEGGHTGFDIGKDGLTFGAEVGGEVFVEIFQSRVIDVDAGDRELAHLGEDGVVQHEVAAQQFLLRVLRVGDGHGQLHAGPGFFKGYDQHRG